MTAPYFTTQPSRLEWFLFALRAFALVLILAACIPPLFARTPSVETQLAVNSQRLGELDRATALIIAQHAALVERVSRIEGIGIGLGMLTAVQLFLQVNNTISMKRKEAR